MRWLISDQLAEKSVSSQIIQQRSKAFEKSRQEDPSSIDPQNEYDKRRSALLDLLLNMKEENELSPEDLREQVDTFIFAGHDTSAHAISWTIWCLATHLEIQNRLHAEIDEYYSGCAGSAADISQTFRVNDLNQLKYLDRCIKVSYAGKSPANCLSFLPHRNHFASIHRCHWSSER